VEVEEGAKEEVLHDGKLGEHLCLVHLDHAAIHLHSSKKHVGQPQHNGIVRCEGICPLHGGRPMPPGPPFKTDPGP
jgi:hypothetical protein